MDFFSLGGIRIPPCVMGGTGRWYYGPRRRTSLRDRMVVREYRYGKLASRLRRKYGLYGAQPVMEDVLQQLRLDRNPDRPIRQKTLQRMARDAVADLYYHGPGQGAPSLEAAIAIALQPAQGPQNAPPGWAPG